MFAKNQGAHHILPLKVARLFGHTYQSCHVQGGILNPLFCLILLPHPQQPSSVGQLNTIVTT